MKTIFVSSTFKDMHFERDAIQEITLPALKSEASKYGENVSFCDLRWGINTGDLDSEEGSRKVLDVCLDEIDRCKPPMVVILGDRYGWIPSEDLTKSAAERKKIELEDLQISVTALEIAYGALSTPERCRQALFYFRHIESDCPRDYSVEDVEHEEKLKQLKCKIDALTGGRIKHYSVSWDGEKLDGVIHFAEMLAEDIARVLRPEWKKKELLTPFERERLTHWSFITEKNEMFSTRSALVQKYYDDLAQNGKHFLAIKAPSGSGKSMLFGNLALKLRDSAYDVVPFMSGLTSESNDSVDILRNTIYYIEDLLGFSHESVDFNFNGMDGSIEANGEEQKEQKNGVAKLRERLFELCIECEQAGRQVVIMVDAIDQLASDDNRDNLLFIPERLSSNVKFVMTCLPELDLAGRNAVTLKPMDDAEKREVIEGILKSHNRELEEKVIRKMIKAKSSNNPLFLSLLVQRLLMMNRDDFLAIKKEGDDMKAISMHQLEVIATCPDSLQKMSAALLTEAGKRINEELVRKVAEYLAVSRHGLRQGDLATLLGDKWSALDFAHFITYMDENFIQRDDGRFDFSHKCIREGFWEICGNTKKLHRHIVEYLESLPLDDTVRMQECVYHYIALDDKARLSGYIHQINGNARANELSAKDLFAYSMNDGGKWLCELLKNEQKHGVHVDMCQFVNLYFDQNISGTLDEMRMRIAVLDANVQLADQLANESTNNRIVIADTYVHYAEARKDIDSRSCNAFSQFYWSQTTYYQKAFDIYNAMPDLIDDESNIVKLLDICTNFEGFSQYVIWGISIARSYLKKHISLRVEIYLANLYLLIIRVYNPYGLSGTRKVELLNHAIELANHIDAEKENLSREENKKFSEEVLLQLSKLHPFKSDKLKYIQKYLDNIIIPVQGKETLENSLLLASIYGKYADVLFTNIEDWDKAIEAIQLSIDQYNRIFSKYGLESAIASVAEKMLIKGDYYLKAFGHEKAITAYKEAAWYLYENLKDTAGLAFIFPEITHIFYECDFRYRVKMKIILFFKSVSLVLKMLFQNKILKKQLVMPQYPLWRIYAQINEVFKTVGDGDALTYKIRKSLVKKEKKRVAKSEFKWRSMNQLASSYRTISDLCRVIDTPKYKVLALWHILKSINVSKKAIKLCRKLYPKEEGYFVSSLAHSYRELAYCCELIGIKNLAIHYYHKYFDKMQAKSVSTIQMYQNRNLSYDYATARLANLYYQINRKKEGDLWYNKLFSDISTKYIYLRRYNGTYWSRSGEGVVYGYIDYQKTSNHFWKDGRKDDGAGSQRLVDAIKKIALRTDSLETLLRLRNCYRSGDYYFGPSKERPEIFIRDYEECVKIDLLISQKWPEHEWKTMIISDYNDLMLINFLAKKHDVALKYGLDAIQIFEAMVQSALCANKEDLSSLYRNIGEVYWALGGDENIKLAREYFSKNIQLDELLFRDKKLTRPYVTLMLSYRRMALLYEEQAQFDEARCYHAKAFDVLLSASSQVDNGTVFKGTIIMEQMCLISNLIEMSEKHYLTNEERTQCHFKAIDSLNWIAKNRSYPWDFFAPMIIKSLKKKIQTLGGDK